MNNFLRNCIGFVVVLFLLGYGLDFIVSKGLQKSQSFHFVDWNKIYAGTINADLIVNGNSKAWHHISPKILDNELQLNSYNLGIDGYDFVMQKAKYDVYKKHNATPKTIIQVVGINTLIKREDLYQNLQFKPYLNDPIIKNATKNYKGFSFLDYNLPFYRYAGNSNVLLNSMISLIGFSKLQKDKNKYKGYEAYDRNWDASFDSFKKQYPKGKKFEISKTSKTLFESYIENLKTNGINTIIVFSPTYYESQKYINNREEIISTFANISKKNDVLFLDYSNSPITKNKDYFYNSQHLNKKGAELFTNLLSDRLKNKKVLKQ